MWFRTCCGILQVLSPPHLPLMKTQLHPPSLPNLHMDRHNSHALVQLGQGGPCGYAADARCHDHMTRNLFRVFFSPVPSLTFPSLSPPRSGPPAKEFGGVLAVKHGRSQAWARGGHLPPGNVVKCFLYCKCCQKVSVDEVFAVVRFWELGLCPWTPLGDLQSRTHLQPPYTFSEI